ncbi:MAG: hypothetical protein ACPG4W_02465 [Flavobacteriales bacterium]
MKLKHLFFISSALFLLYSCIFEYSQNVYIHINNNTNHNIQIKLFTADNYYLQSDTNYTIEQDIKFKREFVFNPGDHSFPYELLDSIFVTYDDTLSFVFYGISVPSNILSEPPRNFCFSENWIHKKTGKHKVLRTFTFTEEDYEEALLFGKKVN